MKSQAGPSSKTLSSVADAEKFLNNMDHSIIGKFLLCAYNLSVFFLIQSYTNDVNSLL